MSQPKTSSFNLTRRTMLAGTAASAAIAGMGVALPGVAGAAVRQSGFAPTPNAAGGVCAAHHQELATHLKGILNSAYVDEQTRNTALRTTSCPHCQVAIAPDMMDQAAFSIL